MIPLNKIGSILIQVIQLFFSRLTTSPYYQRLYPTVVVALTLLLWSRLRSGLQLPSVPSRSLTMHLPNSAPSSPFAPSPVFSNDSMAGLEGEDYISSYFLDQSAAVTDLYQHYSNLSYSFLSDTSHSMFSSCCSNVSSVLFRSQTDYVHKIPTSFAMSGCGWLIPFHLGVLQAFKEARYLNEHTIYAGTSGGAIGALVGCCDIPTEVALQALIDLSEDEIFKTDIDKGLKQVLRELALNHTNGSPMQDGKASHRANEILNKCNHRLHITVTKLWPNPTFLPHVVSQYHSAEHLLDVIAASCFIPLYSSPMRIMTNIMTHYISDVVQRDVVQAATKPSESATEADSDRKEATQSSSRLPNNPAGSTEAFTTATGEYYVDGGVLAFIPPIGEVKISPFPSKYIRSFAQADITLPEKEYSLRQLMAWVLHPGSEEDLRGLYDKGKQAANEWIVQHEKYVEEEQRKHPQPNKEKHNEVHTKITHTDIKLTSMTHHSFPLKPPSICQPKAGAEKVKIDTSMDSLQSNETSPKSPQSTSPLSPFKETLIKLSEGTEQSFAHFKSSAFKMLPSAIRRMIPKK